MTDHLFPNLYVDSVCVAQAKEESGHNSFGVVRPQPCGGFESYSGGVIPFVLVSCACSACSLLMVTKRRAGREFTHGSWEEGRHVKHACMH